MARVRALEWQFDYPARDEVLALERIDRSGGKQAFSYPAGTPVDPSQELADRPILEVRPTIGDPWVGVFYGGQYQHPPAARGRLLGWPDEISLCVVWAGGADVVRSDDPRATYEIDAVHPITDVLSIPDHASSCLPISRTPQPMAPTDTCGLHLVSLSMNSRSSKPRATSCTPAVSMAAEATSRSA